MSKVQRLFVGNLPENCVEQELKNEFAAYGRVKDVELKHKRNADEEIVNTFAFIQIDIDGNSLRQCLQEFKAEKFRGRFLTVTVARENFLDKLKREREEAAARGTPATKEQPTELDASRPPPPPAAALPTIPSLATKKIAADSSSEDSSSSESESDSSSDEDEDARTPAAQVRRAAAAKPAEPAYPAEERDEDGNVLLRKRSRAFLDNGRIRIEAAASAGDALHVIERQKGKEPRRNQLEDDKSKEADKRRLESLGKMKDTYNQQKLAIKQALAGVDASGAPRSNKIVFDAPEPTAKPAAKTPQQQQKQQQKSKAAAGKALFDDEEGEEDYSNDFRIKEQYQGARGAQLMKLQSRFKNDKRFEMDAKFLDEVAGEDEYPEEPEAAAADATEADNERDWQYGILESVMGKRIQSAPTGAASENKRMQQTMLRYDPTKQDHTKYLAQAGALKRNGQQGGDEPVGKKKNKKQAEEPMEKPAFEVSKEQFYKVNKVQFGGGAAASAGGFSLLSMFGTADPHTQTSGTGKNSAYRETLLNSGNATQKAIEDMSNPFKYDTSDDEGDEQQVPEAKKSADAVVVGKVAPKKGTGVWHETFFMWDAEDERMKEGLAFFEPRSASPERELDLENKQKEMRNILKKKVKRSIKDALPHGAKPNKRFRKFVRQL